MTITKICTRLNTGWISSMVLGFRGNRGFPISGIGARLLERRVDRPIQRQWNLAKHSAPHPLAVPMGPVMRHGPAIIHELEILAVRNLVLADRKLRHMYAVRGEFVVPSKPVSRVAA